jgi:hypothetical protein
VLHRESLTKNGRKSAFTQSDAAPRLGARRESSV